MQSGQVKGGNRSLRQRRDGAVMRVAILSPSAELGGAERSMLAFLQGVQGRGLEATVLLPREGPLAGFLRGRAVPCRVIPMPRALLDQSRQRQAHSLNMMVQSMIHLPGYLCRLQGALARLNPDVLYTNGIKGNVLGALLRPALRAKLVWHLRDIWGGRRIGRLADFAPHLIIANSRFTARFLQKDMNKPHKVRVVYNAVDLEEFSPEGAQAPVAGIPQGALKIGLAAALVKWKGHRLLLDAAEKILADFPSARFFFIGGAIYDTVADRGYDRELRRLVTDRGLEGSIIFTGFQQDMAPWYRTLDLVVSCSLDPEPFGRTLLEAMACGKPVVAPDAGGIPEFVRPGVNGLLYEPGNARALAASLITLLRDGDLRKRLGAAGCGTAAHFDRGPQAEKILRVLQS